MKYDIRIQRAFEHLRYIGTIVRFGGTIHIFK